MNSKITFGFIFILSFVFTMFFLPNKNILLEVPTPPGDYVQTGFIGYDEDELEKGNHVLEIELVWFDPISDKGESDISKISWTVFTVNNDSSLTKGTQVGNSITIWEKNRLNNNCGYFKGMDYRYVCLSSHNEIDLWDTRDTIYRAFVAIEYGASNEDEFVSNIYKHSWFIKEEPSSTNVLIIVGATIGGIAVVSSIFIGYYFLKLRNKK